MSVIDVGPFAYSILVRGQAALTIMTDLPAAMEHTKQTARDEFSEFGRVRDHWFIYATFPEPAVIVLLPKLANKDVATTVVRDFCGALKAVCGVFVSEAWYVTFHAKQGEVPSVPPGTVPSQHLDRKEAVSVTMDSPHIKPNRQVWVAEIDRSGGGKPKLKDWDPLFKRLNLTGTALGRFVDILPAYERTDGRGGSA